MALLFAASARADDEPAVAEVPQAVGVVESKALAFARRDVARVEARLAALRDAAKAAAERAEAADKNDAAAVKSAGDAKAAVDKELAAFEPKLKAAAERAALLTAGPKADPTAVREVASFKHNRPLLSVRVDPEGEFLLAGAQDNLLERWDLTLGTAQFAAGHKSWVGGMAMRPDGGLFLSSDHAGRLLWWNPREPELKPLREVRAHLGYARAVALSPDGELAATCGTDKLVRVWSVADGSLVKELAGHERDVYNVGFDPAGKYLISGDLMGVVKQWDAETWAAVRELDAKVLSKYDNTFKADCGGIRSMDFSRDGKLVVLSGISEVSNAFAGIGKPTAVLFHVETGERLKVMLPKDNFDGTCWGVRFDPAGEFLVGVGGGGSGGMWFWKVGEDRSFHFVKLPNVGYDIDFHPDGLRFAVALYDQTIRLYDLGPKPAEKK